MLNAGDTFLIGDDEDEESWHLWIVASEPVAGEVVTVCVLTRRRHSPEAIVVLKPGDHSFIKQESIVSYGFSKIRTVAEIESAIRTRDAKAKEPIDPALLKRVQDGLVDSDFTPNGVRHYYKSIEDERQAKNGKTKK